jgi:hypothetical protein
MPLERAVLEALRPQGAGEQLRQLLSGGLSVLQVFERLPDSMRQDLLRDEENPVLARRAALDCVVKALFVHIDADRVQRRRTRLKSSMVDVYRLRWGA